MKRLKRAMLAGRGYNFTMLWRRSAVAVFPELGLVLNRIKKSGNTSIVSFFHELDGERGHSSVFDLKDDLTSVRDLSLAQTWRLPKLYSLVVVRDPAARLLSGYLHRIASGAYEGYDGVPSLGEASPEGFARFCRWLAEGNQHFDAHFWPQTELMFQRPERFSRIARLETLSADIAEVLRDLNRDPAPAARLDKPHRLEQAQAHKITNARSRMDSYYTDETRALAARLYADDFAALGYDAKGTD